VPPNKHVMITKLSFVRLAAEQHHRAHAGSTAGRTGLLALTRQLTTAPKGGRISHVGAGVAPLTLRTAMSIMSRRYPGLAPLHGAH
jgi:hypothetical protein